MRCLKLKELVGMEELLMVVLARLLFHLRSLWKWAKQPQWNGKRKQQEQWTSRYASVSECSLNGRGGDDSVVCQLEGALLRSSCPFAYFFLVAFEAGGGLPRAALLLAAYPVACALGVLVSPEASLRLLVFISLCGARESAVASVARAVLPKFYLSDLHPGAFRVLNACGRRTVVSSSPRIMIQPFLHDFLGVEHVVASELEVTAGGYFTGRLLAAAAAAPQSKTSAAAASIGIAAAGRRGASSILAACKEGFVVCGGDRVAPLPQKQLPRPVVFHDGRFAIRPSPGVALAVLLWLPFALVLAIPRMLVAVLCPNVPLIGVLEALLGVRIRVVGKAPKAGGGDGSSGVLFVCTHRMLVDPLFLSLCAGRRVTAVTYSISWLSELLAPIRTMRLSRCRSQDARAIRSQLERGDLVLCPEGTTCREPYLLRFSPLFAEVSDKIVPVAVSVNSQIFHGSTARGWKALDPLFFVLNPTPSYCIHFLERLPAEQTVQHGGKSGIEVANHVQGLLADALGYECTSYTRRDKYRLLAGNDGVVPQAEQQQQQQQPKRAAAAAAARLFPLPSRWH